MGAGISQEILPGLYVSGMGIARDRDMLRTYGITHIVSLMPDSRSLFDDIEYLLVPAEDAPTFAIHQHFRNCNLFIHTARKNGGKVLVHCMAGKSRSVTICVAYLMSCTSLTWKEALDAVRAAHVHADPNFGFRGQLRRYFEDSSKSADAAECETASLGEHQQKVHLIEAERDFIRAISADLYDADEKSARAWHAKRAAFIANGSLPTESGGAAAHKQMLDRLQQYSVGVLPSSHSTSSAVANGAADIIEDVHSQNRDDSNDNSMNDNSKDNSDEDQDSIDELHMEARVVVNGGKNSGDVCGNQTNPTPIKNSNRIACGGDRTRQQTRFLPQLSSMSSISPSSAQAMCTSPTVGDGRATLGSSRLPATPNFTSPRLPSTPVCCSRNPSSSALPSALYANRSNVHVSQVTDGDACDNSAFSNTNGKMIFSGLNQRLNAASGTTAAQPRMVIDLQEYFTKAMQDKLEAERQKADDAALDEMQTKSSEERRVSQTRQRLSFSPSNDDMKTLRRIQSRSSNKRTMSSIADEYDDDDESNAPSLTTTPKSIYGNANNKSDANLDSDTEGGVSNILKDQLRHKSGEGADEEMFQLDAV